MLQLANHVGCRALSGMERDDQFRKNAFAAQKMADRAISPDDKESWLRLAQGVDEPDPQA